MRTEKIASIFRYAAPVACGYVPLGAAFGFFAVKMKLAWYFTLLTSVIVYSGSAQFLVALLIAQSSGLFNIFLAILLLSFRHFFYSIAMLNEYKSMRGIKKLYSIFALTDETFALLKSLSLSQNDKTDIYFGVSLLNHIYWIVGTIIGIAIGSIATFELNGIEFVLTALFIALGVDLFIKTKPIKPLVVSIAIAAIAIEFAPRDNAALCALFVSLFSLIAFRKWYER
ncbi:MAG: AzlC family ABC transporter permease [Helicobacteraceae bacterium]|jgi:4-azaleucine resistance transporter AzlC|nr:AzlC family ABC transporter permease [Helicobacteraceae bacterium]